MTRLMGNSGKPLNHPWPEDVFVQGGGRGLVFVEGGQNYTTAFVEAFPGDTFLRGEGSSLEEAEDACWAKYEVWRDCPHDHGYERGRYTSGAGFCVLCSTWFSGVLPPLPQPPERKPSLLEKAFTGDVGALTEILTAGAEAGLIHDET